MHVKKEAADANLTQESVVTIIIFWAWWIFSESLHFSLKSMTHTPEWLLYVFLFFIMPFFLAPATDISATYTPENTVLSCFFFCFSNHLV